MTSTQFALSSASEAVLALWELGFQDLFEAVAQKVVPEVQKLDRCGLAMFCWNFAYISHESAPVFESTAKDSLRTERLAELTPRDVAAISKAFAKAQLLQEFKGGFTG
ncbi:unnamed protein product [Symbiodinium sp. CCMP2592]|nr:unnamed protein product [Symbiodinium sp. CCMP2592]